LAVVPQVPLAVVLPQPKGQSGCGNSTWTRAPLAAEISRAKGALTGSLFSFLTTEPLTELDVNLAWEISTARGFFFLSHDRATQLWERGLSFTVRNFEPEPICTRTGFRNPFKNVAGEISRKGRKHKTAGSYGS
jgi:hypothetical protein